MQITKLDQKLTTDEASEYLLLSKDNLYRMRRDGTGPTFIKTGKRKILYPLSELQRWEHNNSTKVTSGRNSPTDEQLKDRLKGAIDTFIKHDKGNFLLSLCKEYQPKIEREIRRLNHG
jgi:excisionase family DNA binding protein